MIHFITKHFSQLTTNELYAILKLRADVFVVEQQCVYADLDEKDYACSHVMGFNEKQLIAYARLVPQGLIFSEASIGRVATIYSIRRYGYGKQLMVYCLEQAQQLFKTNIIMISAQQYLTSFYTKLGFNTEGSMYLEDGITHIKMRYTCVRDKT